MFCKLESLETSKLYHKQEQFSLVLPQSMTINGYHIDLAVKTGDL
jgi:hypothetical protein